MFKITFPITLIIFIGTQCLLAQTPIDKGLAVINKNNLQSRVAFLSADWFEGRETTTPGAYMAADYLASLYQMASVAPAGKDSTYFQQVPMAIFGQSKQTELRIITSGSTRIFNQDRDIKVMASPVSYSIMAAVVWAGYGLDELNKKHAGKIIVRLLGLPGNASKEQKALNLMQLQTEKNKKALQSGVVAILEYDVDKPYSAIEAPLSPSHNPEKPVSAIYSRRYLLEEEVKTEIPVIKISKAVLQQLVANPDESLSEYFAKGVVPEISANAAFETTSDINYKSCRNVVARIEGSEHPEEIIVVGAHYDHLGSNQGFIWNGADDNASGAIGVTVIAEAFKATGIQPKRTVVFANWTAEERGLLGSRYFVNHFVKPERIIYYHNYDMIGRSVDAKKTDMAVSLLFTDTWTKAGALSTQFNKQYSLGLNIQLSPWDKPTGGSDNASFALRGIPIMWYHTGGHANYHMPDDHAEYIDWQKLEAIVKNSFLTLWELANE